MQLLQMLDNIRSKWMAYRTTIALVWDKGLCLFSISVKVQKITGLFCLGITTPGNILKSDNE